MSIFINQIMRRRQNAHVTKRAFDSIKNALKDPKNDGKYTNTHLRTYTHVWR